MERISELYGIILPFLGPVFGHVFKSTSKIASIDRASEPLVDFTQLSALVDTGHQTLIYNRSNMSL